MTKRQPNDTRTIYQIKVKGHLDEHWSEWFDDLTVTYDEHDDTLLTGPVIDQATLYGLLKKVHDLGIPLISVNPVEPESAGNPCRRTVAPRIDGHMQ